jgi:hypothetical protein
VRCCPSWLANISWSRNVVAVSIVADANRGIGLELAKQLEGRGASVGGICASKA